MSDGGVKTDTAAAQPLHEPGMLRGVMTFVAEKPQAAYGATCASFVAVFVLWIGLIAGLGSDFLPFESDVPLYLRGNVARQRLDAVYQGKKRSDVALNMPEVQLRRVSDRDVDNNEMTFEMLWEPASGNMFSERHLRKMIEVEDRLFLSAGFQSGCLLEWPQEALELEAQAASTGDPALTEEIKKMNAGTGQYQGVCRYPDSIAWGCAQPHPETGCAHPASFPPGIRDCRRAAGCSRPEHFEALNMTFARMKVQQYANTNPFNATAPMAARLAYRYMDSAFGSGNMQGRAVRSQYRLGVPIGAYKNLQDDITAQTVEVGKHIWKHFRDFLGDESSTELEVSWQGYQMGPNLIQEQLPKDGAFALGSMIFVLLYAIFTLQSAFTGAMGIGMIVMGFAPAYLIYFGVFQQRYFGVFNVLSIFIILGIGADNVFVMMDAWTQSKGSTPDRILYSWKRSAGALLVTSITTMASFLSNATSSFPAIRTFGIFAAMLVLVNYCAVITYFISVVSFNERYFAAKQFCCGIWTKVLKILVQPKEDVLLPKESETVHPTAAARLRSPDDDDDQLFGARVESVRIVAPAPPTEPRPFSPPDNTMPDATEPQSEGAGSPEEAGRSPALTIPLEEQAADPDDGPGSPRRLARFSTWLPAVENASVSEMGRVEQWFHNSFALFVIRWRILIILVFHVVLGLFIAKALQLKPDPDPPQFFPNDVTYQSYYPTLASYFQRGGSVYALKQQLIWGFNTELPIDRAGTRESSIQDRGEPVYDPNFSVAKASECIIQICNAAEEPREALGLGGAPEYPVTCPLRHFKQWFLAGGRLKNATLAQAEWAALTSVDGGAVEEEAFLLHYGAFLLSSPQILERYTPLNFAEYAVGADGQRTNLSEEAVQRASVPGEPPLPPAHTLKVVPKFTIATLKLTSERTIDFGIGLDMHEAWEAWWAEQYNHAQCRVRAKYAPGFQNTRGEYLGWDYFFVQEKLVGEAFFGIGISLVLAWVVLTLATHNIIVGFLSVVIITEIVISVIAFAVLMGWKLGILESICFVMVPGMSVDYVAHLAEAYNESDYSNRVERVRDMLTKVGVSVLSGAFSTLGATLFLFFPLIVFFVKFGTFIFVTITYSLLFALLNFSAIMAFTGPQEHEGDWLHFFKNLKKKKKVVPSAGAEESKEDES